MSEEAANEVVSEALKPIRHPSSKWTKEDGSKRRLSPKMHAAVDAAMKRKRAGLKPDFRGLSELHKGLKANSIKRMLHAVEHGEIDMTPPDAVEFVKHERVKAGHAVSLMNLDAYEALLNSMFTAELEMARVKHKSGHLSFEDLKSGLMPEIRAELQKTLTHKNALERGTMGNMIGLLEVEAKRIAMGRQTNIQINNTVNHGTAGSGGLSEELRQAIPATASSTFKTAEESIEAAFDVDQE